MLMVNYFLLCILFKKNRVRYNFCFLMGNFKKKKNRKVERKIHYREKSSRRAIVIYKKVCVWEVYVDIFYKIIIRKKGVNLIFFFV